jgi:hypothetical protein
MTEEARAGLESRDELFSECRVAIEAAGGTLKKIAKELVTIAFSNIQDYIKVAEGGEVQAISFDVVKKSKAKAIKKIRETTKISESKDGETTFKDSKLEFELYDKLDALKYLCKLRGDEPTIANKHEHTGKDGGPIQWVAAPQTASSIADWEAQVAEAKKAAEARAKETADAGNSSQP